ncbi:MAG: nucleotidyltransferase domain-containing protein [Melioribacteraceae bacterium]|nr:nucleotidyltransferase domain-containing protein [Melioribacteraceae bacterium]MCF8266112.1 nucleotidyltransferase domain-containing protein [Melioribacteraceae bacterium]MCF8431502.1 nucleotidyltransferase domain-containing protein [Melioribacteraceae bacterium]
MRLTEDQINTIKRSVLYFDNTAKVVLFGSRTDDNKKGGDIDLLIISNTIKRENIRKIRSKFYEKFGEQKIDLLLDDGSLTDPFKKKAFSNGIQL